MSLFHFLPQSVVEGIPGWAEAHAALIELVPSDQARLILRNAHIGPSHLVVDPQRLDHLSKHSWDALLDFFQRRTDLIRNLAGLSELNGHDNGSNGEGRAPTRPATPTEKARRMCQLLTEFLEQWGPYAKKAEQLILSNQDLPSNSPERHCLPDPTASGKLLQRQARRILPAADQLAREASALVEHAAMPDIDRTELRAHLANFEVMVFALRMAADLPEHEMAS